MCLCAMNVQQSYPHCVHVVPSLVLSMPTIACTYATRDASRLWPWFHEIQTAGPLQIHSKAVGTAHPLDVE
jgi:hypothetical protein